MPWTEIDSQHFIEVGAVHTPSRQEIGDIFLDLIPAEEDELFEIVELGVGNGWLSEAILERFREARIIALDGSPAMLRESERRLNRFPGRFELRQFRLEDTDWMAYLPKNPRCVVSCLVIHHLDGRGKQRLYCDLYQHLGTPGAVIIADLVAPKSRRERRILAKQWNDEVRRQSLEFTGSLDVYQEFMDDHSNWYEHPDPADMPSTVPEHIEWLEAAGFLSANVFWMRAGHAIYGGFKDASKGS
jgi:tRNA (cmo5U34)-methyltransferase